MKHFLVILLIGMLPFCLRAQTSPGKAPDSTALQDTTLAEHGEAGGITPDTPDTARDNTSSSGSWLYLVLCGAGGLLIGLLAGRVLAPKRKEIAAVQQETTTEPVQPAAGVQAATRKLKQELSELAAQLEAVQNERDALSKNLDIYRNFDNSYYTEAFRKLVAPMNEALEKGSRKEILEDMMKIMIHFTSLTRYKIAKKQPYDETNIHYLLNQKGNGTASATEINGDTPVDKIPKNIKPLIDMLKEQGSGGLDDSIIAGYRIKSI